MHSLPSITLVPVKDESTRKMVIDLLQENNLPVNDLDEGKYLFSLVKEENIVGTGGLEFLGDYALVRSVGVKKEEQGKGLGKIISRQLESIARASGIKTLFLLTTSARDFFSKEGYKTINREDVPHGIRNSSEFSSVCPSSALVMMKEI